MKTSESRRQPFIISGEAAEACGPAERALHDPTSWQEHKTAFGLGEFDDLQSHAVGGSLLGGVLSGVALVGEGDLYLISGHFLDRLGQCGDLRPVLLVGRGGFSRPANVPGNPPQHAP